MNPSHTLVFDIETVALPWDSFDKGQQEYLLKLAEQEEDETKRQRKREELIAGLSLYPYSAQIVAIAMLNVESERGVVHYQAHQSESEKARWHSSDGLIEFVPGSEVELLRGFWEAIPKYPRFVTFNGRAFDCPYLLIRSALLGIKPTRNLMTYRFDAKEHCDLMEQLTYYGVTRKYTLDFLCKAFSIPSPKSGGITGADVGKLFAEGKYRELAEYCLGDVRATAELYRRWKQYLSFEREPSRKS
jgi:predicted PolB exonuclease-like 3'-5' exonuclease